MGATDSKESDTLISSKVVEAEVMNPSDPRSSLPPPPPLYPATSSSPARPEFSSTSGQGLPAMASYVAPPSQSYSHIPINPLPTAPYRKIAQPAQRDAIPSQPSVFQQYTHPQAYSQQPYNQSYPEQYFPQPGTYQQSPYGAPGPVHGMQQQYLTQGVQYQHGLSQVQPSLNPQNPYRPLQFPSAPPGITIPQPQHPLTTSGTAFTHLQQHPVSGMAIQPGGSPFHPRLSDSPHQVVPQLQPTTSANQVNENKLGSSSNAPTSIMPQTLPSERSSSPEKATRLPVSPKEKIKSKTGKGKSGNKEPEVRRAVQDMAQQTDKEQTIEKVKNEAIADVTSTCTTPVQPQATAPSIPSKTTEPAALPKSTAPGAPPKTTTASVVPKPVVAAKPTTVAQKKESAKVARISQSVPPGAPTQPPGYHDEKPCEWLVGDLVWAKVSGHPWWPCMVAYDPNLGIYTKMQGGIGKGYRMYHVQFFGEVPERGWVSGNRMRKFEGKGQYDSLVEEMVSKVKKSERAKLATKLAVKPTRRSAWEIGVSECEKALPMSRHERKLNFTFKYELPKNADVESGQIDAVSMGDHPKMKAKRLYKKQNEEERESFKTPESKKKSHKKKARSASKSLSEDSQERQFEDDIDKEKSQELRKRGRKSGQFLKFSQENEEAIKKENSSLSKREIYSMLETKWAALSEDEKAKYESPTKSSSPKKERKRKVPDSTPEVQPVKRSRRQTRPSRRIQESSMTFGKGLRSSRINEPEAEEDEVEKPDAAAEKEEPATKASQKNTEKPKKREKKSKAASELGSTSSSKYSGGRKKARKESITAEMSKDFEEMLEDAPLVIDTNFFPDAIKSCADNGSEPVGLTRSNSATPSVDDDKASTGTSSSCGGKDKGDKYIKKENVCQVCESVTGGELVLCEGGCFGAYHLDCIGLQHSPVGNFKCDECISGNHSCFVCRESSNDLKRCCVMNCGKFYHDSCLQFFPQRKLENKSFHCPLHMCHSCHVDSPKSLKSTKGRLTRCIRCPTAYHSGDICIAAGCITLNSSTMVCSKHFKPVKTQKHHSHVSVSWCFTCSIGGELICCDNCPAAYHADCIGYTSIPEGTWLCEDCTSGKRPRYGDIVWVKIGNYRWWPGQVCNPKNVPQNIQDKMHQVGEFPVLFFGSHDYFWLHQARVFPFQEGDKGSRDQANKGIAVVFKNALKEATEKFKEFQTAKQQKVAKEQENNNKKPAPYKFIKTNKPVGNVQMPVFDITQCQACDCKLTNENPCGPDSDCINRILMIECHPQVCPAGEKCQNQRFQMRLYPESVSKKTVGRGWGLFSSVDIKKGEFVNEYVGELVDEEECRRRILKAHEDNITDFYFLTIDKERIIDAGPKGNLSRFMNHSCQPNCETQKWTVNGDTRVGLFAIHDILAGSELKFNYNLESLGNEKKECRCGAPNCSGFIGVRPKTAAAEAQEEKAKKAKERKRKRKRKQVVKKQHEDECFRCGEGGELIMCDRKDCPKSYHLKCLKLQKQPYGKWECPWHHCDECGKPSFEICTECPNSYCKQHNDGKFVQIYEKLYCKEHNLDEIRREEEIKQIEDEAKRIKLAIEQQGLPSIVLEKVEPIEDDKKRKRKPSVKVREAQSTLTKKNGTVQSDEPTKKKQKKMTKEDKKKKRQMERERLISKANKSKQEPEPEEEDVDVMNGTDKGKENDKSEAKKVNGDVNKAGPGDVGSDDSDMELIIDESAPDEEKKAKTATSSLSSSNEGKSGKEKTKHEKSPEDKKKKKKAKKEKKSKHHKKR